MSKIKLDVVTMERLLISEDVDYVSAPAVDGIVGILPKHAPLLTALSFGELRYKQGGTEYSFAIGGGFMEVRPDKVTVLADVAEQADEIDEKRAETARQRAHESLKEKPRSDVDYIALENALRRAEVRLKVARKKRSGSSPMETRRE